MATPVNTSGALFRPGDTVGRYLIESLHGIPREKEIWICYRVKSQNDGKSYLLKTLSAEVSLEKSFVTRLRAEAKLLSRLNHKNIVGLVESIEGPDQCHLILEFVEGETLQTWVDFQARPNRSRTKQVTKIVAQLLEGLAHVHESGIVHRDLEPAHILLARNGEVKITGFSLSFWAATEGDSDGDHSPIKASKPSDIWVVGLLTYYLLTGIKPSGLAELASLIVPGLDPRWDDFIRVCLSESPEQRYRDGAAALEAFRQLEAKTDYGSKRSWVTAARRWLGLKR